MTTQLEQSPAKPLPRPLGALLILLLVTAFVPHRERALLLTDSGLEASLLSQSLAGNSFLSPSPMQFNFERFGWMPRGSEPTDLLRQRSGPGRNQFTQLLSTAIPGISGFPNGPGIVPLGNAVPGGGPALSIGAPDPGLPGGVTNPGGPGGIGSFPGGGSSGGGGGGISGPIDPAPPPVAVVPEPAVWAMLIMGFGLIGHALRRRRMLLAPR